MRHALLIVFISIVNIAWADVDETELEKIKVAQAFKESSIVSDMKKMMEEKYNVNCDNGGAIAFIPDLFKRVGYSTTCSRMGTKLKLKISAKYKKENTGPEFTLAKYKVNFLYNTNVEEKTLDQTLDAQDVDSLDPFVNAFKKSQAVREMRSFIETQYKVLCKAGSARKGTGLGAANFYYSVTCKNDQVTVDFAMKSVVYVLDENTFAFHLKKFKVLL